ncbi:MAG TPA: hypothetical protein VGO93_12170 [Candidatus Xenobia bacterium]
MSDAKPPISRRGWSLVQVVAIPLLLVFWLFLNLKYLPVWIQVAELLNVPLSFSSELSVDLALWLLSRLGGFLLVLVLLPWALTMRRMDQAPPWLLFINSMVMVVLGWMLLMVHLFAMEIGNVWLAACPCMTGVLTVNPALLYQTPDLAPFQAMDTSVHPTAMILKVGQRGPVSLHIEDPQSVAVVVYPPMARTFVAGTVPRLAPDDAIRLEPDQPIPFKGKPMSVGPKHPLDVPLTLVAKRPGEFVLAMSMAVQVPSGLAMPLAGVIKVTALDQAAHIRPSGL